MLNHKEKHQSEQLVSCVCSRLCDWGGKKHECCQAAWQLLSTSSRKQPITCWQELKATWEKQEEQLVCAAAFTNCSFSQLLKSDSSLMVATPAASLKWTCCCCKSPGELLMALWALVSQLSDLQVFNCSIWGFRWINTCCVSSVLPWLQVANELSSTQSPLLCCLSSYSRGEKAAQQHTAVNTALKSKLHKLPKKHPPPRASWGGAFVKTAGKQGVSLANITEAACVNVACSEKCFEGSVMILCGHFCKVKSFSGKKGNVVIFRTAVNIFW